MQEEEQCSAGGTREVQRDARKLPPPATATSSNSDGKGRRDKGAQTPARPNTCSAVLLPDLHRCQTMDSESTVIGEVPFLLLRTGVVRRALGLGHFSLRALAIAPRRNEFPQSRVSRMLVYHVVLKAVVQIYKYC